MLRFPSFNVIFWTIVIVVLADVIGITDMLKQAFGGVFRRKS